MPLKNSDTKIFLPPTVPSLKEWEPLEALSVFRPQVAYFALFPLKFLQV